MMNPQLAFLLNQAVQHLQSGNLDSAEALAKRVVTADENNADAYHIYGVILGLKNRYSDAIESLQKALKLKPKDGVLQFNLAKALMESKQFIESLPYYKNSIQLIPGNPDVWINFGKSLSELGHFDEALVAYEKAILLEQNDAEVWSNKGVILTKLKRFDEAIAAFDKSLSLSPDSAVAWYNKGFSLHDIKSHDEAIINYDKAISLKPDYHEASWNKSLTLLLQGDFENGFSLYESRWHSEKISATAGKRSFERPTWLGVERLEGKTILLYGEQGLGDFIQFSRYAKLVADLGATVILEAPLPLADLMKDLEGVSQLVVRGNELPYFDYQCPLLSIPLALNTKVSSIPASTPYLFADPNKINEWKIKLGEKRKRRIGLVWSSVSGFKDDSKRSLILKEFVRALPSDGFEYICLQKELKGCDHEDFENYKNIRFFGNELKDFSDTAALIENLDLVISSCTSVPHLSAALGKETWVLLSHVPDWRWLLDRGDSPWYPSMRLYRQTSIGDWNGVLDSVKSDLSSN